MTRCHTLLMFALVAVLSVGTVLGADDAQPKKKKPAAGKGPQAAIFARLSKLDLSDEQKDQVAAIKKEFGPKLQELTKAVGLSKDQKEARMAAMKQAKEKGLKGKEARDLVDAATSLTDEQKEAQKAVADLNGKIREKLAGILTDEQKKELGIGGKKPAGDKKKKKKPE